MIDESILVDLINRRFSDLNDKVDDLKQDLFKRQEKHESEDSANFQLVRAELEPLKKMKYSITGALSVIMVLVELLKSYLHK